MAYQTLTDAQRTQIESWLVEAENALHRLRIGKAPVRLRHGLKDETFAVTSVSSLMSYIDSLKSQLGQPTGRQRATRVRPG